jgi:hypothetical protein
VRPNLPVRGTPTNSTTLAPIRGREKDFSTCSKFSIEPEVYVHNKRPLACFLYRPWLPIVVTLSDNFRIYESDAWSNRIRYPDPSADLLGEGGGGRRRVDRHALVQVLYILIYVPTKFR